MNRTDIPTMAKQLNVLADVFDKRHVSENAAVAWFDTLKEFPVERVTGVLISWPRSHVKFPVPAEVWRSCNDMGVADRERQARADALVNKQEFHPGVGGRQAGEFLKQMKTILKQPKWSPRQHWEKVLETAPNGSIGKRYAAEALMKLGAGSAKAREPGQDDEELAA